MNQDVKNRKGAAGEEPGTVLVSFFAALQFLTVFPPLVRRPFTPRELGRSVASYPLVGILLGAVLVIAHGLLDFCFPPPVSAALVLVLWVLLTGALHLDGLMDACDGLLGGRTPESRLHIMHDERVGAFGLAGGVLLLLVKFAVLVSTPHLWASLLLAPVLGRWGMALALVAFPYARREGLGRDIKDNVNWGHLAFATLVTLPVAWFMGGWGGLLALAAVCLAVMVSVAFALRRIPGLTGDIYGALCELSEMVVLLVLSIGVL